MTAALDRKRFGSAVRRARQRSGLTQAGLAEAAGVTDETISRLERGAFEPSLSTTVAVADALGVRIDTLIHGQLDGQGEPLVKVAGNTPARRTAEAIGKLPAPAQQALRRITDLLATSSTRTTRRRRGDTR